MTKTKLLIACACLLLAGCSGRRETLSHFMFENEVGLKADSIRINEIFTPAEWVISDDILLLRSKEDHPIFYTYSLPELKFIESFGFKGRGPDEYIAPYIVRNGDGRIYLYDNGNRKLKTLRPSKDGHVVTDVGTLSGTELFNGFGHIEDDRFYGVVETPNEIRLNIYAIGSEMRKLSSLQVATSADGHSGDFSFTVAGDGRTIVTADWNQKIVTFRQADRMDITATPDEGGRVSMQLPKGMRNAKTIVEGVHDSGTIHYIQLYCNGENFYALHIGVPEAEAMTSVSHVEVFDAEGNGLTRLRLDRLVSMIVVDDASHNIYALSPFGGDYIYRYKLP